MHKKLKEFNDEKKIRIKKNQVIKKFQRASSNFLLESIKQKYSYNFTWMGVPIIQIPQDMYQIQEIIWDVKPDLIIETGIAHGGSLIFNASMLAILNSFEQKKRKVIGIDIDLRKHNKDILNKHFLKKYIQTIDGSSIDTKIFKKIKKISEKFKKILVILDSNHTHEHVLGELNLYSQIVSKNSYCIVFDTIIHDMPNDFYPDRDWDKKKNPMTAVNKFLNKNKKFEIDLEINNKLMITMAKNGYLRKK